VSEPNGLITKLRESRANRVIPLGNTTDPPDAEAVNSDDQK
jgi:hypothetical protein